MLNHKYLWIFAALLAWLFGSGCAAERAATKTVEMAGAIGTAIIEKSHITDSDLSANANLNNPHYRVWAVMVNGVMLDIGLDGVQVGASARGSGSGDDKPLSEETKAAIRERLNDPGFVTKLGDVLVEKLRASSQPTTEGAPAPLTP